MKSALATSNQQNRENAHKKKDTYIILFLEVTQNYYIAHYTCHQIQLMATVKGDYKKTELMFYLIMSPILKKPLKPLFMLSDETLRIPKM